jgi:CubicO group peptidase (beta-lactamase class C family)
MSTYTRELAAACAAIGVTGASFAYWDGGSLHTAVAGLRNSVTGDPVTVDTVMHIGSITKVLNAVPIMQLVDDGAITLEDPVSKHLPELRLRDRSALERITCAMLLNHTSGINCDWLPEYGPDQERIVDAIERCADLGQLHAPGEATSYSNMGPVIAGYLAQKLRGISWYTLMRTRLFEPLGMAHSLADPLDVPRFRCSVGDVTDPRTRKLVQTRRPFLAPSFAPAGSTVMTSATDLVTFARALLNGGVGPNGERILSAAAASRMAQPTAEFLCPVGRQVGLGWLIMQGGVLTHSGGGRGVNSMLFAHPASGRALALLTNCDRGFDLRPSFVDPILESWTGQKVPVPQRRAGAIDSRPYEGVYENNLTRVEVFSRPDGLALRLGTNGQQMGDLFDIAPSWTGTLYSLGDHLFEAEFASPGAPARMEVRFDRPDAHGRMRFLATGARLLASAR